MIARTPRTLPCYLDFDGYCDACGDARHECKDTHMGHICSACRTLCAFCGDWLLLDSIALDNQKYHVGCAAELAALSEALVTEFTVSPMEVVILAHYSDLIGGAQ